MKISLSLVAFLMILAAPAMGAEYRAGETVAIGRAESLDENLFAASRKVQIDGRINGDIYAVCEQLNITGNVTQDIHAGCRFLTLRGQAGEDVLFMGQELLIDGEIAGDVLAFGTQVKILPNAIIHGDVMVAAGALEMEGGWIKGKLKGTTGNAYINGTIDKSTDLSVDRISFGPDFQTQGHTRLTLNQPLAADQAAQLPEDLEIVVNEERHERSLPSFSWFGLIWSMAAAVILGLIPVIFCKPTTLDYLDYAKSQPLQNTGLGFVYLVLVPVVAVILMVLIFTIPIGLSLSALYLIALYLGGVMASLSLGDWLWKRIRGNQPSRPLIPALIIGVILVQLLTEIPFIGWLIGCAVVCYGLGSLVHFFWNLRKMPEGHAEA